MHELIKELQEILYQEILYIEKNHYPLLMKKLEDLIEKYQPKKQEFKVGWVYEDESDDEWLVARLGDSPDKLARIIRLCDGFCDYYHHDSKRVSLIHSTGKKWEIAD